MPFRVNALVTSPLTTTLARFALLGTSLAARSAAKSTSPAGSESSLYSSTSAVSLDSFERKPIFGRRRCMGIWPPSKPALVLPRPEPMPRPTRFGAWRAPAAGLRVFIFMESILDLDQVVELVDQATHLRAVFQHADAVELAQAKRLHRQAMTR